MLRDVGDVSEETRILENIGDNVTPVFAREKLASVLTFLVSQQAKLRSFRLLETPMRIRTFALRLKTYREVTCENSPAANGREKVCVVTKRTSIHYSSVTALERKQ